MITKYTQQEIETAIKTVFGWDDLTLCAVVTSAGGWGLPRGIEKAAAYSWFTDRPDDQHSDVLRRANADLVKFGYFKRMEKSEATL